MKKIVIICFLLTLVVQNANADAFGASDSVIILRLTSIYQAMKDFYNENVKILNEARAQSDELKKLSKASRELQKEFYFVKNFSIQQELSMIKGDIRGLTNLNRLSEKSPQEQINIIRGEIDRRFKASKTPQERQKYAQMKSRIEDIERLNALKKAKTEEAKTHGTEEQSQKTSMASIASSCALMGAYQTAQEQRKIEEALASQIHEKEREDFNEQFVEALDHMR